MESWMQTYCGRFDPLQPMPSDVHLEDIAYALSNICRFGGHTHRADAEHTFYSVAQHSILVSHWCPPEYALWGLLHDGGETYLGDMVRPLKSSHPLGTLFIAAEQKVLEVIALRFGLVWPMPLELKAADDWMLAAEARDLMGNPEWVHPVRANVSPPLPTVPPIVPMDSRTARYEFLLRFYRLHG